MKWSASQFYSYYLQACIQSFMYSQVKMTEQNTVPAVKISFSTSSMIHWHLDNWKVFEKYFLVIWLGSCLADALYHYWVTHSFPPPRINSAEIAIAILYQRDRIESDFSGKCKLDLHNFKKQWHYLLLKWYSYFKFKLTLRQRTPSPK